MGRVTEYIAYLNSKDEKIDKSFTHLTITDKIAQKRHELIRKKERKQADVSLTAEKGELWEVNTPIQKQILHLMRKALPATHLGGWKALAALRMI